MKNKPDQSFCNDDLKERVPDGHKKFGNKGLNVPVCTVELKNIFLSYQNRVIGQE